ncbi:transcriptional regulator [Kitasatospora herbaricolor]|uniref:MarR family transcriptional regulator n=1 Tax=Kitasatospora herbaricolor TaxID=68217 RepID=UPI00199C60BB|nr:MarR family transcriptional regulator [Kitasatospora herbaricolor]MDQ0312251.1 DNA-binding MarR family transcriptional regulator [Kitasatospora herbaricolor]GGV14582.1 transcriptional regulator [Kitasatospora herbaricolor]
MTDEAEPDLRLVHQLRALTIELNLLGGEFAQRNGLHPTDLRALVCLLDAARAGSPATPGLVGAQLGLNSAGTTALLDRLERLGHVRRVRDTRDRRRVLLEVEDRAVALGQAFFGPLISGIVAAGQDCSEPELAAIRRFLGAVQGIVAEQRAGTPAQPPGTPSPADPTAARPGPAPAARPVRRRP